jgi:hypothetical protein
MTEHRNVIAILAYHAGAVPSFTDFTMMMKGQRWSLDRYWADNAAAVVAIDRFDLAGPYPIVMDPITMDALGKPVRPHRKVAIQRARQAAQDAGVDLSPYDATFVVVTPGTQDVGGTMQNHDVGAFGSGCLMATFSSSTFCQHETGHVLGFAHSQGVLTSAGDQDGDAVVELYTDYGDPYDIMSAESFAFASPTMAVAGTPASYPRSSGSGPMLARAELYLFKHDHMDAAGTVAHRIEDGNTSVELFAAGTGGAGRPELLVYRTRGAGEIYVEYRRPGPITAASWWDTGLTDATQREGAPGTNDVAAGLVIHYRAPNRNGEDAVFYAARIAFPDADLDATFSTPDGVFTVSVSDAQHAPGDSAGFTIARGAPASVALMVHEESSDQVTVLTSELRTNPRYPSDGPFTWEVRRTVRTTTYVPRVRGVGIGWPQKIGDHSDAVVEWLGADGVPLAAGSGRTGQLGYRLALGTGVLTVTNDPADGTLSVPIRVQVRDHSLGSTDPVRGQDSVTFSVQGSSQGWGADFFAFLGRRLRQLVHDHQQVLVVGPIVPDPVLVDADALLRDRELLTRLDPDAAREVAVDAGVLRARLALQVELEDGVHAVRRFDRVGPLPH